MGKEGAPFGNQNARKHGFYSKFLTETEKMDMEDAGGIEGLEDEMALLRVKLGHLLEDHPDRIDLHMKAVGMIVRLARARRFLNPEDTDDLQNALTAVYKEVGIPLGIKFTPYPGDEKEEWSEVPAGAGTFDAYCHSSQGRSPAP
ncbi:hypothetical protein ACFLW2_03250 [Chloroflexota bacterium]